MEATKLRLNIARATMTLLALLLLLTGAWAGDVTPEQALQEAQTFMSNRRNANGGPRYAPGAVPQLTLASKVSGLYVFNVAGNGGYIIVSNEDRTIPILGYSESGTFNAASMPANMRAWLQGYADQIAWLKQHDVQTKISTQSKNSAQKKAPRRIGSHSTNPIGPLVKTTWDQDAPYNNLCPIYSGSNRSVTGCVATAMAQVMKYHKHPTKPTKAIPGYTTGSYGLELGSLTADVTFDWDNMLNSYSGSYSSTQATAVATLMQYCGWSVGMDYGPSSGSDTPYVADALKEYFDYSSTTKFVSRTSYSDANWTDLIYYELAHGRPVVYGGMSSGGGHEFVCDGYDYVSGTDLFHINWGWGGQSDNYFVLSALNPSQQGTGGSSSTDGFNYGQDAVIGIQPSDGTGTMSDITPSVINLTVNSMTLSDSPVVKNTQVTITANITNNGADKYDGYVALGLKDGNNISVVGYNYVTINSGATRNVTFTFTPTANGTYDFVFCHINSDSEYDSDGVVMATLNVVGESELIPDGLTVYDGTTTNQYVPAYIYYFDAYTRSQFVIPAAKLTEMNGGTINSISFYTTSNNIPYATVSTVDVYLKEVGYTSISAFETKESSTIVYQGKLKIQSISGGGLMTIQFATPYEYNGGNLMIGIENTTDEDYSEIYFYGQAVEGASVAGYNANNLASVTPTQRNFIPKTTFVYDVPSIKKPKNVTASNVTYNSAEITWTDAEEGATAWQIVYDTSEDFNPDNATPIDVTTKPYTLTNLTPDTQYYVCVRVKKGSDFSKWSVMATFTTAELYSKPTAVAANNVTYNSASISWTGSANSYNLRYRTVVETVVFSDDFESGMGNWTITRNGAGTTSTDWRQFDPNTFSSNSFDAHSGEFGAMSRSWSNNSAYSVDNWLITPQVALGGTLKYWVIDDGTYHEHYDIYVSTTTNDISAFTKVYEPGDASDTWTEVTVDLSAFAGQNGYIAFRHTDNDQDYLIIDDVTITGINPTSDWTTVNDVTSPYSLTGLTDNTMYQLEVQGVYADGTSGWAGRTFTTLNANPVPSNIQATLVADGATLTWSGLGDSYNVQYRIAANEETFFFEGFEDGIPDTWTTIDADGDGNNWLALSEVPSVYGAYSNVTDWAHSGSDAATSPSYANKVGGGGTSFTSDQYLISPKLNLQGTLRFYATSEYSDLDSYEVLLSTTGTNAADFTTTLKTMAEAPSSSWDEVSIDLSSYAGQQGYIAIHHVSENMYFLVIDDFGLYGTSTAAGSWQDLAPVTEATATLSGLATNNSYEYRVQSVRDGNTSGWSEPGEFTLLTIQNDAANTSLIVGNRDKFAHVTLGGRTLYRDGTWNTLTLPFDLVLDGSALAGATARPLSAASIEGTTLTLAFGSAVDKLTAGTPYIIKWTSGGSNLTESDLTFSGVTINNTVRNYNNGVSGDLRVQFIGTYDAKTITTMNQNILFMGANNNLYYPDGKADTNIGACRAYFLIGSGDALAPVLTTFNIDFGDGTTEITTTNLTNYTNSDAWYTIDGRCVANGQLKMDNGQLPRGVYIHNGKKVVIK